MLNYEVHALHGKVLAHKKTKCVTVTFGDDCTEQEWKEQTEVCRLSLGKDSHSWCLGQCHMANSFEEETSVFLSSGELTLRSSSYFVHYLLSCFHCLFKRRKTLCIRPSSSSLITPTIRSNSTSSTCGSSRTISFHNGTTCRDDSLLNFSFHISP